MELTESQSRVLSFIEDHIDSVGFPPTRLEIAKGLGFASSYSSQCHLMALQEKGVISVSPKVSRGIRLTN